MLNTYLVFDWPDFNLQLSSSFRDSRGIVYPINLYQDVKAGLPFNVGRDSVTSNRTGAKIATLGFLLNAKAQDWQRRAPRDPSYDLQRKKDSADIIFCLMHLQGRGGGIDKGQLRSVYSNNFLQRLVHDRPSVEKLLQDAGLSPKDETRSEKSFPASSARGRDVAPW